MHRRDRGPSEINPEPTILYIASAGHSGSTLLDMVLGGHPKITSAGEFHRLSLYARANERCTCGATLSECPFWMRVAAAAAGELGQADGLALMRSMDVMLRVEDVGRLRDVLQKALAISGIRPPRCISSRVIGKKHCRSLDNSLFWLRNICKADGTDVVVDSTKDVRRLKLYFLRSPQSLRVLHLVRDGRAVSASAMRRMNCTMAAAASDWRRTNGRILSVLRGIPADHVLFVRYEDFCRGPEGVLARICAFLGLTHDGSMMELQKQRRHNVGGNSMRFKRDEAAIRMDDKWTCELSKSELDEFRKFAGKLNGRFGYD